MPAFLPGPTVSLSATTSSSSISLGTQARTVRVYNAGSVAVFIKFGNTSATAATTDLPIAPGSVEAFDTRKADIVAGSTASGSATVYFTVGEGE